MMRLEELTFDFFKVSEAIKIAGEPVGLGFVTYLYRNYFENWGSSVKVAMKLNDFFLFLDKKVGAIYTVYLKRGMLEVEIDRKYWSERVRKEGCLDIPGIKLETADEYMPILNYKIYIDKLAEME